LSRTVSRLAYSTEGWRRSNLDRAGDRLEANSIICLAQCLGSFVFGAVLASIATSLFLAARQDFGGKNRPGA
jgi:hypothetical protein